MSCAAVAKDMGGAVIMHACVSKRLCEICNKITTMLVYCGKAILPQYIPTSQYLGIYS